MTVNAHKGFYAYQSLTYGIASAPALFQSTMDQIVKGMTMCIVLLMASLSERIVMNTCKYWMKLLTWLERQSILVKESKGEFMVPSVEFLGYLLPRLLIKPSFVAFSLPTSLFSTGYLANSVPPNSRRQLDFIQQG